MNTKDVIYGLRTKNGLSQDELAEKVFVTRQAVSRWENGETVPNTETLKRLSELFNVSINTLLGSPQKLICQCCGMPLEDEIIGRNQDGSLNEQYCKWCYADGTYTYSDMDELIDVCVKHMVNDNFTEEQARAYMKQKLPQLDYWKRYGGYAGAENTQRACRRLRQSGIHAARRAEGEIPPRRNNLSWQSIRIGIRRRPLLRRTGQQGFYPYLHLRGGRRESGTDSLQKEIIFTKTSFAIVGWRGFYYFWD